MDGSNSGFQGGDAGGDWPKASIGNYKGVMLCNRPNEFGQQKRPERTGLEPFKSRVDPKVPIGWNPSAKLLPRQMKKKANPNSILVRHKKFLKQLGTQIVGQKQDDMDGMVAKANKTKAFRDAAARQREKIKGMKTNDIEEQNVDMMMAGPSAEEERIEAMMAQQAPQRLTADNLSKASSKAPSVASKKKKQASTKPAWANTAGQIEDAKEAEIDDLLEFAYELDYEKYMEDYEVRQALAIIKDRVNELAQEPNWKEQMAEEWNQANEAETNARREKRANGAENETRSQVTYKSHASKGSNASYMSRVSEAKRKEAAERPEWNGSTTSERKKPTVEDRIANKIASEVLRDNTQLRGIHSNNSIKVLLEKEAKRQMAIAANGGAYTGPVIAVTHEKGNRDKSDPSNLPYLHKNPAV